LISSDVTENPILQIAANRSVQSPTSLKSKEPPKQNETPAKQAARRSAGGSKVNAKRIFLPLGRNQEVD
jgi:hypothetical protein